MSQRERAFTEKQSGCGILDLRGNWMNWDFSSLVSTNLEVVELANLAPVMANEMPRSGIRVNARKRFPKRGRASIADKAPAY
jgi:hypothetical protein